MWKMLPAGLCESWPVRADWTFRKRSFKARGAKNDRSDSEWIEVLKIDSIIIIIKYEPEDEHNLGAFKVFHIPLSSSYFKGRYLDVLCEN